MILEFLLLMSLRVLKILTTVDRKYTINFFVKKIIILTIAWPWLFQQLTNA